MNQNVVNRRTCGTNRAYEREPSRLAHHPGRTAWRSGLSALLICSLWGCATVKVGTVAAIGAGAFVAYRVVPNIGWQRCYRCEAPEAVAPDTSYLLHFVESDDQGAFYDTTQATAALRTIEAQLEAHNVIVILYAHGWHNNAKWRNHDVNSFRAVLAGIRRALPESITNTRIVGIYAGWRGRALPWLLDYTTFYGRKAAAQRVGRGDLRTLLYRLQRLYDEHTRQGNFMGFVTIGHSFGGEAVFEAARQNLEQQLYYRWGDSLYAGRTGPRRSRPRFVPPSSENAGRSGTTWRRFRFISPSSSTDSLVRGYGDATFLINPAVEASAFDLVAPAYRQFTYDAWQAPVLIVIDGRGDKARRIWFPFGRSLGVFGSRLHGEKRKKAVRALGVYDPHVTHRLRLFRPEYYEGRPDTTGVGMHAIGFEGKVDKKLAKLVTSIARVPWDHDSFRPADLSVRERVRDLDLSGSLELAGDSLVAIPGSAIPNSPVMVIRTDTKITGGHSDVFRPPFVVFLVRFIEAIEAKTVQSTSRPGR